VVDAGRGAGARAPRLRLLLEVAVAVVFLLLIWHNYTLRRQLARAAAASRTARGFVPNDTLASVPTLDRNGNPGSLDLENTRTTLAIVDPRCDSCRELLRQLPPSGVQIVSVAPVAETAALAKEVKAEAITHALGRPLPSALEAKFHINPQVFVVDRGRVVRTCVNFAECR
jgi:hypothetical protein